MLPDKILDWVHASRGWIVLLAIVLSAAIGAWGAKIVVSATYEVELAEIAKEQARLKEENATLTAKASEKTVEVVTKYVDRVRVVKQKGDTIVKEVPVYVTDTANRQCTLTRGFAAVHDSSAKNIPIPKDIKADEPIDTTLSDAAKTISSNYTTCNEIREQLISLQEWVRVNTNKETTK